MYDALVIGSGISALGYALEVSEHGRKVCIVTKKSAQETNTNYAQGGIAAVLSPTDSFDAHVRDTLQAGAGLCRSDVVRHVVQKAPEAVQRLIHYGVRFDQSDPSAQEEDDFEKEPAYDLGREGGHSHRRVLHAQATSRAQRSCADYLKLCASVRM